jgi:hypothetical protein
VTFSPRETEGREEASIVMSGPGLTAENIEEAAEAMAELVNEVGRSMTGDPTTVSVGSIQRLCDGCGATAVDANLPADWVSRGGNDFCSACWSGERER